MAKKQSISEKSYESKKEIMIGDNVIKVVKEDSHIVAYDGAEKIFDNETTKDKNNRLLSFQQWLKTLK